MKTYALLLIPAAALWILGLWLRGFFGDETSPLERKAYGVRLIFWLIAIAVVAWPLQLVRGQIGSLAYVMSALAIALMFFWLGILASRALANRESKRPSQGA